MNDNSKEVIERFISNWKPDIGGFTGFCFKFEIEGLIATVYNQAIDDFVELMNEMPTYENEYGEIMPMPIEMMAEKLKKICD